MERFVGKVVYSKYIFHDITETIDTDTYEIPHGISNLYYLRSIEVHEGNFMLPHIQLGAISTYVERVSGTNVVIGLNNVRLTEYSNLSIHMRYTKNES